MTITPAIIEIPQIIATPQIDILPQSLDDILNHLTKLNITPTILLITVVLAIILVLKTVIVNIQRTFVLIVHAAPASDWRQQVEIKLHVGRHKLRTISDHLTSVLEV